MASFPTDFPDHLIFAIRPLTRLSIFTSNQNDLGPEHYCHPITCLSLYFIRYQTFLPEIFEACGTFQLHLVAIHSGQVHRHRHSLHHHTLLIYPGTLPTCMRPPYYNLDKHDLTSRRKDSGLPYSRQIFTFLSPRQVVTFHLVFRGRVISRLRTNRQFDRFPELYSSHQAHHSRTSEPYSTAPAAGPSALSLASNPVPRTWGPLVHPSFGSSTPPNTSFSRHS